MDYVVYRSLSRVWVAIAEDETKLIEELEASNENIDEYSVEYLTGMVVVNATLRLECE